MRTKIIYCAVLALVLVAGCTSELALEPNTSQQDERGQASQRSKAEPQTMTVSKHFVAPRRVANKAGAFSDSSPYRYLGYGYKAGNGIIGHPSNLTYQIFDNEISNDGFLDNNSSIVRVRESQAESYAFSTYNTYLEESKSTLKFSSELSGFNILPFSIGFKDSFEKTFASQIRRDQRQMMGIVNLFYRESNVKLNSTRRNIERISSKYLARDFLDNLYNISIKELIDNYGGGYVVCDYSVGGRATATYLYNYADLKDSVVQRFESVLSSSFSRGNHPPDLLSAFRQKNPLTTE